MSHIDTFDPKDGKSKRSRKGDPDQIRLSGNRVFAQDREALPIRLPLYGA
ncbi:MAG: hypothetical protein CM15mP130_1610 [Verrucomicrobiota bacterium]|nr:MAG: hypothetical protein CM15mP130_1610 [Verrucomicrobiota bacterium]